MNVLLLIVGSALGTSFLVTLWLVWSVGHHGHLSADHDLSGPQKFHARPVPRIGGVGIAAAVIMTGLLMHGLGHTEGTSVLILLACALPAFVAGVIEDLTKRVSAKARLVATMVAAALAAWTLDSLITRTAIPGLDWALAWVPLAWLLTLFAVGGVANSINIIDGFNGLASMCSMLILGAIAYVAFEVKDVLVAHLALACLAAILGFFVFNYPAGLIFLGDGGAYFVGFMVAETTLLLLSRNPQVSPMFGLLVCVYPIWETVFSMYRRKVVRNVPSMAPDGIHLHSLVYRRLMRWAAGDRSVKAMTHRNSMTSPYLWALCTVSIVPSVLFWNNTPVLVGCLVLFVAIYVYVYGSIVKFRTPRWLRLTR